MDGFTFSLSGLPFTDLPGGLVFLVAVFFVSVVAMLKNFLPHWLSDHSGSYDRSAGQIIGGVIPQL